MSEIDTSGSRDFAERLARARWGTRMAQMTGTSWDQLPGKTREAELLAAEGMIGLIEAAGLAVVELPEATVSSTSTVAPSGAPIFEVDVSSPDGRGWEITGQHIPGYTEDRVAIEGAIFWSDVDRARRDACRILAACDAVDRLRAEHSGGAR